MRLESERLILRKLRREDIDEVAPILGDIEVMYAWEKAFSREETAEWIEKNLEKYERDGYSYLIAHEKSGGECIGLIGPLVERVEGTEYPGIAYIIKKEYWKKGYAAEGAGACMTYLFNEGGAEEVVAQIKHDNEGSIGVARKLGMICRGKWVREYEGKRMPHYIFSIGREEFRRRSS
ncbi:acetyltransferase [Propionigenium maris DSM 9537]|uniref:Acetyltransferase n=1 Tax=Propionigenium maris DSM 9537 TaxID=1123000 RepID=A0A9W6GQ38_9FUSO|nr:GNAT family N-acetyltransferase [Propionigenium maris]GLI57942.1 acetyltransferase [Propionigenium maris DSM 9537]